MILTSWCDAGAEFELLHLIAPSTFYIIRSTWCSKDFLTVHYQLIKHLILRNPVIVIIPSEDYYERRKIYVFDIINSLSHQLK